MSRAASVRAMMSACVLFWLLLPQVGAQTDGSDEAPTNSPVAVVTNDLPQAVAQYEYEFRLEAQGGTPPYTWQIEKGELPRALHLDARTGAITGTALEPASVPVSIRLTDSAEPPQSSVKEFTFKSVPAIEFVWERTPR